MKKIALIGFFVFLLLLSFNVNVEARNTQFEGKGEVMSVDPMLSRITIKHQAIKDFSGEAETDFFVSSGNLLKGISKRDWVEFTILESHGDTRVTKITKTGEAAEPDDRLLVGKAVQDVLVATGEAAKTVVSPIEPAHEVVSGTVGATTDVTGAVLKDATPEVKKKF